MAKITLASILAKFSSITKLNANFTAIATAFENTLSRDGTAPNAMEADLDMDSNSIINLPVATTATEPIRLGQLAAEIADISLDWQGAWTTATAYTVNQAVSNNGSSYIATADHTSGASTEPGVGGSFATVWDVLSSVGATGATGATGPSGAAFDSINAQTGTTYTFVIGDADTVYVTLSNASAITLTVPPNSSVAFDIGTALTFEQTGAGAVTVAPGSGVTINKNSADTLVLDGQYSVASLIKTGTDAWTITGRLVAA